MYLYVYVSTMYLYAYVSTMYLYVYVSTWVYDLLDLECNKLLINVVSI